MTDLKQTTNDKYVKAFISVAEMLEPNVKFDNIIQDTKVTESGVTKDLLVSGKLNTNVMVQVTTEQHPTKGMQLVIKYIDLEDIELIEKRSYWYFSFNWKGLSAIA